MRLTSILQSKIIVTFNEKIKGWSKYHLGHPLQYETFNNLLLFLHLFLDALGEHGNDLVEVAHDAQVSYTEDGGKLVLVDGDDEIALLHTGEVLDGTADTASHVEVGTNGLTGLTHLYLVRHHAVIDHST